MEKRYQELKPKVTQLEIVQAFNKKDKTHPEPIGFLKVPVAQ